MRKKIRKPDTNHHSKERTANKYVKTLKKVVQYFSEEFPSNLNKIEKIELAVNAWNIASVYKTAPDELCEMEHSHEIIYDSKIPITSQKVLNKMVDLIRVKWPDDKLFIKNLEVLDTDSDFQIHITIIEQEEFIANMVVDQFEKGLEERMTEEMDEEVQRQVEKQMDRIMEIEFERQMQKEYDEGLFELEFQEGFVNRAALIITPLKPFIDWARFADPEFDKNEVPDYHIYLIDEDGNENWLQNNFHRIFEHELEYFDPDYENWPSNRNYQMFEKWFSFQITSSVYDLSEYPLGKGM